jgi:hypothetical protein
MKKFEYMMLPESNMAPSELYERGQQGWELVSVVPTQREVDVSGSRYYTHAMVADNTLYFKREMTNEPNQ